MLQSLPHDRPHLGHASRIWKAGVEAVQPIHCLPAALAEVPWDWGRVERLFVVGGGKAGAAMVAALEAGLENLPFPLDKVQGWVNVPDDTLIPTRRVHLHPSRPIGVNHPTDAAFQGTQAMLDLLAQSGPRDWLICLLSGGGSALLCAPVSDLSLAEKQQVTQLLHRCGASIQEMNAVRKHLSQIKGGGLVRHWFSRGVQERHLISLIISDVIGDPLDVIASGPTAVDPTTFADAVSIIERYGLPTSLPPAAWTYLQAGMSGTSVERHPETLKQLPTDQQGQDVVWNRLIANSRKAVAESRQAAEQLGYEVIDGGDQAGDTSELARNVCEQVAALKQQPLRKPICLLSSGETTVRLPAEHGLGGRNQEWVLAMMQGLGASGLKGVTLLSGGTDGEDGPTDAAGAWADEKLWQEMTRRNIDPKTFRDRHDAYHFFETLEALFKTGLTNTNVMDLRVVLIHPAAPT